MNPALPLLMASILLVPAAQAGTYHREVIGPSAVDVTGVGQFGVTGVGQFGFAACDNGSPALVALLACGTGGIGATIDISDLNASGPLLYAVGECSVEASGTNPGGGFSFLCGVDRDDDGFVTNVDTDSIDPDGFDDDFAGAAAPSGSGTVGVCFRSDGASSTGPGSWDYMHVFIATNVPQAPAAVGFFSVDVTLFPTFAAGCVSGHTHDDWYMASNDDGHSCGLVDNSLCLEFLTLVP